MLLIQTILPFLLLLLPVQSGNYTLQQDLVKDAKILSGSPVFITDNTSATPTINHVAHDLKVFGLAATIDLSKSNYSTQSRNSHAIQKWEFKDGPIKAVYQIETTVAIDTIVVQRYLENRAPTQHRVQNTFTFRVYALTAADNSLSLYYLTEKEQGLLEYKIGDRHIHLNYPTKKEGLNDIQPAIQNGLDKLLSELINQD
jgi:hypothetical protein